MVLVPGRPDPTTSTPRLDPPGDPPVRAMPSEPAPLPPTGRLLSIDALRGFDMFWIVGGDQLARALARWSHIRDGRTGYDPVRARRVGGVPVLRPDLPAVPVSGRGGPAVLARRRSPRTIAGRRIWRIGRRTVLLFALGLLCNNVLQFDWENLRVAGVLQRIAVCYGIAAVLTLNTNTVGRVVLVVGTLLGYWALLANVAAPGGTPGDYSKAGNLAGWVDRNYLPGKILEPYYGLGDNEGLLSTIPAVATTLLGVLAGGWLRSDRRPWTRVAGLLAAGLVALAVGVLWGSSFPIIKNLWTSSFVLVAGGLSLLLLALFHAVIDVLGWSRWAFFFAVIGANAITIYVVPRFVDFEKIAQFFLGGVYRLAEVHVSSDFGWSSPPWASSPRSGCSCSTCTVTGSSCASDVPVGRPSPVQRHGRFCATGRARLPPSQPFRKLGGSLALPTSPTARREPRPPGKDRLAQELPWLCASDRDRASKEQQQFAFRGQHMKPDEPQVISRKAVVSISRYCPSRSKARRFRKKHQQSKSPRRPGSPDQIQVPRSIRGWPEAGESPGGRPRARPQRLSNCS